MVRDELEKVAGSADAASETVPELHELGLAQIDSVAADVELTQFWR
jgi:hypothetical protein